MNDLRYPIGRFERSASLSEEQRSLFLEQVAGTPAALRQAIAGLDDTMLDTPYREGGWTLRQVVHHLPDSHLNAYCRFKLALTEEFPTIRPYEEDRWAELPDSRDTPVEVSLTLLESLHARWVVLLRAMKAEDFARRLNHPVNGEMTLDVMLALYAWHGRHHVAHITSTRERERFPPAVPLQSPA